MLHRPIFKLWNNSVSISRKHSINIILIIPLFLNHKLIKLEIRSLRVKLADFGLSRTIERSGNDLSLFHARWTAPDVWDGYITANEYNKEGNIDPWSEFFSVLVFIAVNSFPFSVFVKNTNGFLDLVSDVVFGFFPIWVPVSLRSERQICTTTDLECRKTSVRSTYHHCIGSIRVLITGM